MLHLVDVVVETQVLGAKDGKRTDDAVVTTTVPARVIMRDQSLPARDYRVAQGRSAGEQACDDATALAVTVSL